MHDFIALGIRLSNIMVVASTILNDAYHARYFFSVLDLKKMAAAKSADAAASNPYSSYFEVGHLLKTGFTVSYRYIILTQNAHFVIRYIYP